MQLEGQVPQEPLEEARDIKEICKIINTADKADGEFLLSLFSVMRRDIKTEFFMPIVGENISMPCVSKWSIALNATRNLSRQELRKMQNGMAVL